MRKCVCMSTSRNNWIKKNINLWYKIYTDIRVTQFALQNMVFTMQLFWSYWSVYKNSFTLSYFLLLFASLYCNGLETSGSQAAYDCFKYMYTS
jgi:hypothetical protein